MSLELKNVGFKYGENVILKDISFKIKGGSYVGLIGPNGSGKTTLVKIILGILQPTRGKVEFSKKMNVGYVPQRVSQLGDFFPATVLEVVQSGMTNEKISAETLEDALKTAGIAHLKKRLIGDLSGGERQKVFIARALISQPGMLILDEPTVGVDPAAKESFYKLLKKLNKEKEITVVLVSHELETVSSEVDTVLCLNRSLVCAGPTEKMLSKKGLENIYGKAVKFIHHQH